MDKKSLPRLYQSAYTRDDIILVAGKKLRISIVRAGTLRLPSGKIVACDPLVGQDRKPFVQAVLPGHYPVDLSLGYDKADAIERILFARILFTKNRPIVWVKAFREGERELKTEADIPFGLMFTSGTGAFMDKETAERFRIESIDEVDQILDELVANYSPDRNWLNHNVDARHNVIMFSPGHRAEVCPTYFAIDDAGDICLALIKLYV